MKGLWNRGVRLAVITLGFAGLIVALNAIPGAATPASGGFISKVVARGTYVSSGSLPLKQGMEIVTALTTAPAGSSSGWHSHPGGAIVIVGCLPVGDCQSEITTYRAEGNHCFVNRYTNGQSFIERPDQTLIAINNGSTETTIYATYPGVPVGGLARISQPDPMVCPVH